MRRRLLEDRAAIAQLAPVAPGTGQTGLALDHHEDDFTLPRGLDDGLPGPQAVKAEPDIPPARAFGRDAVNFAMGAEGAMQKLAHVLSFRSVDQPRIGDLAEIFLEAVPLLLAL